MDVSQAVSCPSNTHVVGSCCSCTGLDVGNFDPRGVHGGIVNATTCRGVVHHIGTVARLLTTRAHCASASSVTGR